MNSLKQSSFTCSNCKTPFYFSYDQTKIKYISTVVNVGKTSILVLIALFPLIYITIHLLIIFALLVMNIINSLKTTVITTQLLY